MTISYSLNDIPEQPGFNDKCGKCGDFLRVGGKVLKLGSVVTGYYHTSITWDWYCEECADKIAEFIGLRIENS